jgi:hypothetical protein
MAGAIRTIGMNEAMRIATTVGTPIALGAVTLVLAYFAYVRTLRHREKQLEAIPPPQRAKLEDETLTRYGVSGEKLTKAQVYELLQQEMRYAARRDTLRWVVVPGVVLIAIITVTLAYLLAPAAPPAGAVREADDLRRLIDSAKRSTLD